jgi:hypothetical protein
MSNWLTMSLALVFFFVTTFLVTWAIREGGSFAFLTRSYWKRRVGPSGNHEVGPGRRE